MVQILDIPPTSGICDRYATPLGQLLHQLFINAFLQTFIIRSMNQKFRTVRLERLDRCCAILARVTAQEDLCTPSLTSISVIVCHLFIATNQVSSFLRQLRSMTSFSLSPPRAASTKSRCSCENLPEGKRKEVMMTYYSNQHDSASTLS